MAAFGLPIDDADAMILGVSHSGLLDITGGNMLFDRAGTQVCKVLPCLSPAPQYSKWVTEHSQDMYAWTAYLCCGHRVIHAQTKDERRLWFDDPARVSVIAIDGLLWQLPSQSAAGGEQRELANQTDATNNMRWLTLQIAARRGIATLDGEHKQELEELLRRLRFAAAEKGLCDGTVLLDAAVKAVIDWKVSHGASYNDAMQTLVVDVLAELTSEAAASTKQGEDESDSGKDRDQETKAGHAAAATNRDDIIRSMQPSERKAYAAYEFDESKKGCQLEDKEAYELLCDDGIDEDEQAGYSLPSFATWSRYLRKARSRLGEQKHSRLASRATGKTVVRRDEI